eukprot:CAMPEP_0174313812 /NCGR_PEP_ID=MMETSP0810-20121108/5234_1 /TAXON_ID=73025 ORGANISM="Eutreptiella gymnastica-like, Strain CCMP1594" /NCGR_SAMPLE_ID=MMETSP0810 /ASSEMBLY_ACC=CAM_ASM_000659 /LENGTH=83 /DNA_ID=CAMNT_0015422719 /DNA_START=382 /DNA_END=633 /DNA_ORIENTATION=-
MKVSRQGSYEHWQDVVQNIAPLLGSIAPTLLIADPEVGSPKAAGSIFLPVSRRHREPVQAFMSPAPEIDVAWQLQYCLRIKEP